jgi:hypothetical protein
MATSPHESPVVPRPAFLFIPSPKQRVAIWAGDVTADEGAALQAAVRLVMWCDLVWAADLDAGARLHAQVEVPRMHEAVSRVSMFQFRREPHYLRRVVDQATGCYAAIVAERERVKTATALSAAECWVPKDAVLVDLLQAVPESDDPRDAKTAKWLVTKPEIGKRGGKAGGNVIMSEERASRELREFAQMGLARQGVAGDKYSGWLRTTDGSAALRRVRLPGSTLDQ